VPASRPPNVLEHTWLAYAFERPVERGRVEAALDRVGEHYQEVMADPLVREASVGARAGLALWHRGDERLRWPLWADGGDLVAAWTSAPTGWRALLGDLDPAEASTALARRLVDDPELLAEVNPPFVLGALRPTTEELVILADAVGAARLYEMRTNAGTVWSNRLGALPLFAGTTPEADPRGWQILAAAGWFLGSWTAVRGARKLLGGSVVRVRPEPAGLEIERRETSARSRIASPRDVDRERAAAEAAEGALACAVDVRNSWAAPIAVDLTGGRDSRVAAAAVLAAGIEAEFQTVDADPGEVDVVRKLIRASKVPIQHLVLAPEPPSVEADMFERLRLLHHHHDGMVNPQAGGRGAIEPLHHGYEGPVISGTGGEIGHGFYYRNRKQLRNIRGKGRTRMVRRMMLMARKGGGAARRESYLSYRAEVEQTFDEAQSLGLSGPRLLDYFYFAQRLAHRSGLGVRNDRYSPCSSAAFMRACFDLRPAERLDLVAHRAVIARLAPEWNGIEFFAGAGTAGEVNYDRPWERERDATRLEQVIFEDESWHDLFEPDAVQRLWSAARSGLGTAHHERLFLRIAWRASFEEHLALLARRAAGTPLLA
jgi:hypothetical protein